MVEDVDGVGRARVDPSRFLALKSSSSYQLEDLVASLLVINGAGPAFAGWSSAGIRALDVDDAVTAAFLRRRLMRYPSSSSEEVKPESEAGGGVASFLRKVAFALPPRFLKANWGTGSAAFSAMARVGAVAERKVGK